MKQVYINQFMSASSRNLLPLSAGLLYSYSRTIPEIRDNFGLNIEMTRDIPAKVVAKYKDPAVLGFSAYFWNFNQSIQVAKSAKAKFPEAKVIFGGPIVPLSQEETRGFFKKYPFVDIIVPGEGEVVFSDILLALIKGKDLSEIEGVSYYDSQTEEVFYKKKRAYIKDLSILPSPYLDGTFDRIYEQYKDIFTGAILETNRGCPYSCTYCFWGGPDSRIVTFPLDRIYAEIDWISRHKINYISGADANFGILKRDIQITKQITSLNKETGYPKYLAINWAKNTNQRILEIADILNASGVKFMLTTSLQSSNPSTLEAIKRDNIKFDKFDELVKISDARGYHIHYSEFILGLPLETYQSFVEGIRKSLIPSLTYCFNIYYCFVIPSTQMTSKEYREKYKIETRRCLVNFERTIDIEGAVPEYEEIAVATSTMPIEDWKKSFTFGYLIKTLYGYRTAYFLFNYLRQAHNVDLIKLTEFIIEECTDNQEYEIISQALKVLDDLENSILSNQRETVKIDGVKTSLHPEAAVLITFLSKKEAFYRELYDWFDNYFMRNSLDIDDYIWKEVFTYQISIIPTWKDKNKHHLHFTHNIPDYFALGEEIVGLANKVVIGNGAVFKDADDFMNKRIYGGLKFYILDSRPATKEEYSREFIDAKEFFESLV